MQTGVADGASGATQTFRRARHDRRASLRQAAERHMMARPAAQHMSRALGPAVRDRQPAGADGTMGRGGSGWSPNRHARWANPDGGQFRECSARRDENLRQCGHGSAQGFRADRAEFFFHPPPRGPRSSKFSSVHPSLPGITSRTGSRSHGRDPGQASMRPTGIGSGSHISTEMLTSMADIKLSTVPYRWSGHRAGT